MVRTPMAARWPMDRARIRYARHATGASLASIAALAATLAIGKWIVPWGVPLALALAVASALLRRGRALGGGELAVEGDALQLRTGGALRAVPRASIASGWVVPDPERDAARVELQLRDGRLISAEVSDGAVANAALEALGFDARQRALRVTLGRPWDGLSRALAALLFGGLQTFPLLVLFTAWLGLPPTVRAVFFAVAAIVGFTAASRFLGPAELVIGADGLSVRRGFRPRFLPYRALQWVDAEGDDIVLLLTDKQRVRVSATNRDRARAAMVVERIRRAAAGAQETRRNAALALLDRNGRSVSAWREGVCALAQSPAGYRGVGVEPDALERVLADPAASAERRIAAAMCLAALDDERARTRVRVVAEACASEPMRAAFEATLRGDLDDALLARATDDTGDIPELRRGLGV